MAALRAVLPAPPVSVLDVGCGHGALAAALRHAGYTVTAIDPNPEAVAACRELGIDAREQELAEVIESGFAAVICSRVLHHLPDLPAAVGQLARLLDANGVLVVDEFDRAAADAPTAAWFYGTRGLLAATGTAVEDDTPPTYPDPLARWQHEHTGDPPLHTGAEVEHALQSAFAVQRAERTDGLWIYLCQDLDDTEHAGQVATHLRDLERCLLATQAIAPVGLRITAHSRQRGA